MLTLYHSPMSRSTTVVAALDEMGITDQITIRLTNIRRADGSGGADPANPHLDGKVPALDHDGTPVTERPAILTYLSDLFPQAPAIRPAGHQQRGPFLSWLAYYGGVVEPVMVCAAAEVNDPIVTSTFRDVDALRTRLITTFADGRDYLLPDGFSTADLLMASPFVFLRDQLPEDPNVNAWFERVMARSSMIAAAKRDAEDIAALP
jgi:glutathione S-transferase